MTSSDMTVRIGEITHERAGYWAKDDEGQIQNRTCCGVFYTYERHKSSARTPLGVVIGGQDIDCMSCLVAEARR